MLTKSLRCMLFDLLAQQQKLHKGLRPPCRSAYPSFQVNTGKDLARILIEAAAQLFRRRDLSQQAVIGEKVGNSDKRTVVKHFFKEVVNIGKHDSGGMNLSLAPLYLTLLLIHMHLTHIFVETWACVFIVGPSDIFTFGEHCTSWRLIMTLASQYQSPPCLSQLLTHETRNTALQIVKHTECCKSIVRARSGVNLSRPHFLPTGRPCYCRRRMPRDAVCACS